MSLLNTCGAQIDGFKAAKGEVKEEEEENNRDNSKQSKETNQLNQNISLTFG